MNKATPVEMRKCLVAVEALKMAGVRFVPMPVLSDKDNDELCEQMRDRLEKLEEMCSAT
jgi:tagatose-1,6-bisphosphate aldolase